VPEGNKDIRKKIQELQTLLKKHSGQGNEKYRANLAALLEVSQAVKDLVDCLKTLEAFHASRQDGAQNFLIVQQANILITKLQLKKNEFLQAYTNRYLSDCRN
jgi:hypothetical protein